MHSKQTTFKSFQVKYSKAMKRLLVAVLLLLVLVPTAISATEFWGSKTSNKYHYPTCKWTKQIKSSNLIKFRSPEEAQKAGYIPCPVCKPPKPATEFWGSKTSNKYHYPMCKWTKQIKSSNLIKFRSPEEAQKAGYIPCPLCKPPKPTEYFSISFKKDMTDQTHVFADFYSGNDLVELMKADADASGEAYPKAEEYLAYIIGVYDATSYAYNTPQNLTKRQVMVVVTNYLMHHPEQLGDPASLLVIRALKEAFPK
jgi:methylphosphotriester-DNA--protein-cysteine methyltransferase